MNKKRIILLFAFSCLTSCHQNTNQQILLYEKKNDQAFITNAGEPTKLLQDLFKNIGYKAPGDLNHYNEIAQKEFFRTGERWQIKPRYEEHRSVVLKAINQSGWQSAIFPMQKKYDYALILGSTVQRMHERMEYFIKLIKAEKISVKEIIFHVSDRPLDRLVEPASLWTNIKQIPKTECDAALALWKKLCKRYQITLRAQVVNHPMIVDANSQLKRPHTGDVVDLWFSKTPVQGSILAISNQPYCQYQKAVLLAHILKNNQWKIPFSLEVVGAAPAKSIKTTLTALHLDNIARYIYASKMVLDSVKK